MASLEQRFTDAAEKIRTGPPVKASNADRLAVYALYKQATVGDVEGEQPGFYKLEARAKWDAWAAKKGLSKDEAMEQYLTEIERQAKHYAEAA